ncbi:MAG TPA: lecithin retinol acyltransferase family protein [Steroidobacteraceae bacterium]|nr:lecithin retinol acyltransferase family protein [Steroidobacteraceae bacterium]
MNGAQIFGNRLVAYQYAYSSRRIRALAPGEEPAIGAHLVAPWRGFAHHGIYVGDGRIVHYNARVYRFHRRPVEETSMAEFHEGRPMFVVSHDEACEDVAEIVRRARSRVGEDRYHLLRNNCEHLVEWCLHGKARSFQVESALDFPRRAGEFWRARLSGVVHRWVRAAGRALRIPGAARW